MQDIKSVFRKSAKNNNLIATQEGYTIEYKQAYSWGGMAEYARAMVSMANNRGGYIIFGIKDKPHELLGLDEKQVFRFEERDLSKWSEYLRSTFEPSIEFERFQHEYDGKIYGVIKVFPAIAKPIICKKYIDGKLREGAIYYRYKAENKEIQYAELRRIIDEEERRINALWMEKIRQISVAGVSNTMVLDTNGGLLSGNGKSFYIGSDLLDQIRFVDRGRFVEKDGEPVFQIIGDVQTVEGAPISVEFQDKEVAISDNRILESFLKQEIITDNTEYCSHIMNTQAKNLPFMFLFDKGLSISEIFEQLQKIVGNNSSAEKVKERLVAEGHVYFTELKNTGTSAWAKKNAAREKMIHYEEIYIDNNLIYVLQAIRTLSDMQIMERFDYLLALLLRIYSLSYQREGTTFRGEFKKVICYIDEIAFKNSRSKR